MYLYIKYVWLFEKNHNSVLIFGKKINNKTPLCKEAWNPRA